MANRTTHPVLVFASLAAILALLFFGIYKYRHRFVTSNADLVQLIPQGGDSSTFFVDAAVLRQSGYLNLFTKTPRDPDYRGFVDETNFDYATNVDAAAGSISADRLTVVAKGRFDWSRLTNYARHHGGRCSHQDCELPASQPGRFISFAELQPDVVVVVTSAEPNAAAQLVHAHPNKALAAPADPVWVRPSLGLLRFPNRLPFALRSVAIVLQSANNLLLSLNTSTHAAAFDITLSAHFENGAMADTARTQLTQDTELLKQELKREHAKPNAADLTGFLTSGIFSIKHQTLTGVWPVPKELLDTLR